MSHELVSFGLPGNVSRVGWTLPDHLSERDWVSFGKLLARVEGAIYWIEVIGGHMGEATTATGRRWLRRAIGKGRSFRHAPDAAWVSRRIETSRRREVLG